MGLTHWSHLANKSGNGGGGGSPFQRNYLNWKEENNEKKHSREWTDQREQTVETKRRKESLD